MRRKQEHATSTSYSLFSKLNDKPRKLTDKSLVGKRIIPKPLSLQQRKKSTSGFTLYSDSELEENTQRQVQLQKGLRLPSDDKIVERETEVLTQIQIQASKIKDNMSFEEDRESMIEKLDQLGVSTPFNKRLVSSTPEPERLLELKDEEVSLDEEKIESNNSLQMIPERDMNTHTFPNKFPNILSSFDVNLCEKLKHQRQLSKQQTLMNSKVLADEKITMPKEDIPMTSLQHDRVSPTIQVSKAEWTDETVSENNKSSFGFERSSTGSHAPLLESQPAENTSTSSAPSFKHCLQHSAFTAFPNSHSKSSKNLSADEVNQSKQAKSYTVRLKKATDKRNKHRIISGQKSLGTKRIKNSQKEKTSLAITEQQGWAKDEINSEVIHRVADTSVDTCDLEVTLVNEAFNEINVALQKERNCDDPRQPGEDSSNVSQIIELLKANPLHQNTEKQYQKIAENEKTDLDLNEKKTIEKPGANEKLDDIMSLYIPKADQTNEVSSQSKDRTNDTSNAPISEISNQESPVNKSNNVNQNYNSDSENEASSSRQKPKNLHYLESMADPTLRNIACRLSFKATALRDIELRNLIDDMIYFTDAALGKENSQNQASYFILREDNFNLKQQIERLKHQLEVTEMQEIKCSKALENTNIEVMHLETKLSFLMEEKNKLDSQVTSLLEERAQWLANQQDLLKTLSLKEHEILKLNEKHHHEKKSLHQSIEQVSRNTHGVHKKLSGADRQIEKLQERLKCKDLDMEDLREQLKDKNNKLRDCEEGTLRKDEEVTRLRDLVDSLKLGVDNVLQAFESSYSTTASAAQRQGIEHLRRIIHPEYYSFSEMPESSKTKHHSSSYHHTSIPNEVPGLKVYKKAKSSPNRSAREPEYGQDERRRERTFPSVHDVYQGQGGASRLTSRALEEHNQRLSPIDRNILHRRAAEETYFSDADNAILNHYRTAHDHRNYTQDFAQDSNYTRRQRRKSESDKYERHKNASVQVSARSHLGNSEEELVTVPISQSLEEINYDSKHHSGHVQKQTADSNDRHVGQSYYSHVRDPHTTSTGTHFSTLRSVTIPKTHIYNGNDSLRDNDRVFYSTLRSEAIPSDRHVTSHWRSFRDVDLHTNGQSSRPLHEHYREDSDPIFATNDLHFPERYEPRSSVLPTALSVKEIDRNKRCYAPAEDILQCGRTTIRSNVEPNGKSLLNHDTDDLCSKYGFYQRGSPHSHQHSNVQFDEESTLKHPGFSQDSQFYNMRSTLPSHSSPLHTSDTSVSRRATRGCDSPGQREFFQGTELSLSISSITDPGSVNQTWNNNEVNVEDAFTTGIASLDEKIANLQKKINRTKAIFTK